MKPQAALSDAPAHAYPVIGIAAFLAVAALIYLGGAFQNLELSVYDRLLGLRSATLHDAPVTLVTITDDDLTRLQRSAVPDGVLADVLQGLLAHHPRAIGVDLYRDIPLAPGTEALAGLLNAHPEIIVARKYAAQQDLFIRTAKAYFAVLAAQDNLAFATAERDALEQQMRQAERKFGVGELPVMDVREAEAGHDLAVANVLAAQRAVYVAKVALREIIGVSDIELARLAPESPLGPPAPATLEAWSELSQRNNLGIIAAENHAEAARKNVDVQFAGHLPTLDLVGAFGYADTERPAGLVANSQSVGLQVNVPLYQGGGVSSKVRQAERQADAARQALNQARRGVEKQVQDAFYGVMFSISQAKALSAAVGSSRTAVQAAEAGLKVGMRTMVDVLGTQRGYYRAQRDHAQARYDYIVNSLSLKQGASTLTKQDIEQVNGWLEKGGGKPGPAPADAAPPPAATGQE